MSRADILRRACQDLYTGPSGPVCYAQDILGLTLTPQQEQIIQAIRQPPYRVAVPASTNAGKSFAAAVLASFWFDTFENSLILTTGPTLSTVRDCVWKELRELRQAVGLDDFCGPASLRMRWGDRIAAGIVSRDPTAFQGRHSRNVLIIFDEATGIRPEFWDRALPMLQGDNIGLLAIGNPTTTASRFYMECESGDYSLIQLSALDHPNIACESRGEPAPFPSAVRLATLDAMLRKWCQPVAAGENLPTDIEWPLGSGQWLRPGPEAEGLLLGRWPTLSVNSVWSLSTWQRCEQAGTDTGELTIGLDVARFGDDFSSAFVRKGGSALEAVERHGLSTIQTAALARDLADRWGQHYRLDPRKVPVRVDDAGVGGGVTDQGRAIGYNFRPCLGASSPNNAKLYPNRRSESWFDLAEDASEGRVSFARLPGSVRQELRRQLLGVTYTLDDRGRRVVEDKAHTKSRLKRSPDVADAAMLAFGKVPGFAVHTVTGGAKR